MVEIAPWLLEKIRNGEAILFLGAGASYGAIGPNGEKPLSGEKLRDILCDRFLGGTLKDKPLTQVAEYAKNESSLIDVQKVISDLFSPLQPAGFHLLIPAFRWYAIITTNYDFVIERAYERANEPLQQLATIIRDDDRFHEKTRDPKTVSFLKLHGSLSVINDPKLPLILASEEYAKYRRGRERLFRHFQDWGMEYPIIFCGYNIADPHIQQILFDLGDLGIARPMYAVVDPSLTELDFRYWQSRRFVPIKATFEEFINYLNTTISADARKLSVLRKKDAVSIQPFVRAGNSSDSLLVYLEQEIEHVRSGMPFEGVDPQFFFKGEANSWSPIAQSIDVRRKVTDELLIDIVLDKPDAVSSRLFLLKGHAGSGKSVTLRRFAWEAAIEQHGFVFWLREGGYVRADLIRELFEITGERPVIVIQDGVPHLDDIRHLIKRSRHDHFSVDIVIGARTNEWNIAGGDLENDVTEEYELRDLSSKEIDELIAKLSANNALGSLGDRSTDERRKFFALTAERQLLVALHEATSGKPFEDIVFDEYKRIVPQEAQLLYLDVCTLHRFKVGVRAGLLSRASGITLDQFRDRLFRPLEHLVSYYYDPASRDYAYRTRHSVIADMVFRQVLADQEKRADQLIRIVSSMNLDYQSDSVAFEQLIRGRDIAELFADRVLADRIFTSALDANANVSHVEHQRAVFELHHPGGNVVRAFKAIEKAIKETERPSQALFHTKAMVLRRMATESSSRLEREKLRNDAKEILSRQMARAATAHPFHAYGQILLDELIERTHALDERMEAIEERIVSGQIADAEKAIAQGLQHFPGEPYLLELESRLAAFLRDTPRAVKALEKAFEANPGAGYVALRLARQYKVEKNVTAAKETLIKSIERNPNNKVAHLELAKLLIEDDEAKNSDAIRAHLKASFTEGDSNYDAQFWFARHEYLFGDRKKAQSTFGQLSKARASAELRQRPRAEVREPSGAIKEYEATVVSVHDSYCFVSAHELGADVFIYHYQFGDAWDTVKRNAQVRFQLAFNFRGPVGMAARVM